jgi:hypothetical protein
VHVLVDEHEPQIAEQRPALDRLGVATRLDEREFGGQQVT